MEEAGGDEETAAGDELSGGICGEEVAGGFALTFGRDAVCYLFDGSDRKSVK